MTENDEYEIEYNEWFKDSKATSHITCDAGMLSNIFNYKN